MNILVLLVFVLTINSSFAYNTTTAVYVRSTPQVREDNDLGILDEGTKVYGIAYPYYIDNWHAVLYQNQVAFICSDYID